MAIKSREMIRQIIAVDGRDYCCYFKGNLGDNRKADILFFNGLFSGASAWAYQTRIPDLLRDFRLIMFDYPCQGGSFAIRDSMRAEDLVDDAVRLAQRLELKKPLLVGHSFGGLLAGLVAGHPDIQASWAGDLQGIVIANGSLRSPLGTDKLFWEIQRRLALIGARNAGPEQTAEGIKDIFRFFIPIVLDDEYLAFIEGFEADLLASYADYNRNPAAVAWLLKVLLENNRNIDSFCQALARVQCPVRVIAGANDKIFPVAFGRELAAAFATAEFNVVEKAGHSVMIEQNKVFNRCLLAFVESLYRNECAAEAETAA